MFTGIVTDLGRVRSIDKPDDTRLVIETGYDMGTLEIGASISCSGVCLTVVEKGEDWFSVDASQETLDVTNLGAWQAGTLVNLERSLRVGDEMGGHMVSGHVDGFGEVTSITAVDGSIKVIFSTPAHLRRFIAPKGSVAVNGVSLTVNETKGDTFSVNIIPHTRSVTTFQSLNEGEKVNLEVDTLARYVARIMETA